MFKPLSLYIGLRYTRAKRRNQFISFISLVSMIGIALGVAVLITVLSVMNGFDQQIQYRIFSMVPHVTISSVDGSLSNWPTLMKQVNHNPQVKGVAPVVNGQAMLMKDGTAHAVMLEGIDPTLEKNISVINDKVIVGSMYRLKAGAFGIAIGQDLANSLGLNVGDDVNVMIPQASITPIGILPRFKRFTVEAIFSVGTGFGFDSDFGFIHLSDAQKLYVMGDHISELQIKVDDLFQAPMISMALQKQLGFRYQMSDWTDRYGSFYHAVQMEKTIMFFILLLLIAIAVFNLVSSLVMLVNDKQADIAILRTFGATPRLVMNVFVVQGCIVGVFGTLIGVIAGVLLSLNVTALVNFIQSTFHVQLLTSGVYFVDYLPSQLQWLDVLHISIAALAMSLLATVYPAWRAARIQPVEALRYE